MVSALKVDGRRLHELAREGIEVERAPRPVTVHSLAVEPTADPLVYSMHVHCSSGTYVRSLAADLGELLGGGAHLRALRRTVRRQLHGGRGRAAGSRRRLHPPTFAVRDYASLAVGAEGADRVRHGRSLDVAGTGRRPVGGGRRRRRAAGDVRVRRRRRRQARSRPQHRLTRVPCVSATTGRAQGGAALARTSRGPAAPGGASASEPAGRVRPKADHSKPDHQR